MPGIKAGSPKSPSPSKKGKGKQRATPPASSSPRKEATAANSPAAGSKRARTAQTEQMQAASSDNELLELAQRIADNAHLLVRGAGSDDIAEQARNTLKRSFDKALASESTAFPHLSSLLSSLSPSAGPSTRSRSAAGASSAAADDDEQFVLAPTPISELTVDGMDPEMVWAQMELRQRTVDGLMEEMFGQGDEEEGGDEDGFDFEEEDEEDEANGFGDEDEEEEDEDDEMAGLEDGEELPEAAKEEYYRRLGEGKEEGLGSEDFASEQEEDEAEPAPRPAKGKKGKAARPSKELPEDADETSALTLDNFDGASGRRDRAPRRPAGPPSAVDDDFFSLADFHRDADLGEYEMSKRMRGEALSDDEDEDEDDLLGGEGGDDGGIDYFAPVGGAGGLGGSDDEDDDGDEEEEGDLDAAGVMFADFFDPPHRAAAAAAKKGKAAAKGKGMKPAPAAAVAEAENDDVVADASADKAGKRGVRFSENVKVKEIPHRLAGKKRGAAALDDEDDEDGEGLERLEDLVGGSDEEMEEGEEDGMDLGDEEVDGEDGLDEDEDEDDDEEDGEGDEEDDLVEDTETIQRFNSDLFDDDEQEDDKDKNLSRHERRLLQLSSQIAQLEQENVGPKEWATLGEAQSRDRPVNSLLEEDLEFERMGKVAPVITEETTRTIEDLIKRRILDSQFDDVERRVAVDPNQFLPSRYMDLQDTKSQKSLAEVYEDEFREQRDREQGREAVHELDADLQKRHDEIEALFEDLASRLDALSNAHFTPKAPKAAITTLTNLPSITVESALPTASSTSALLAPEEVYAASGPTSALAVDAADLTPAQKKALRQKGRQERKWRAERAERILASQERKKGARGEKEAAERKLIGTKGVTVLGKGGKEKKVESKKRKRGDGEGMGAGQPSSVALKL
ncbi:uncharacterized protein JCM10292_003528 [Rhodotorula paludigena]|uniref:uncharacterized protein n=1 Tax=Rhodotorula paludigena TaxID=86838 RepID=UPI0031798970